MRSASTSCVYYYYTRVDEFDFESVSHYSKCLSTMIIRYYQSMRSKLDNRSVQYCTTYTL